MTDGWNLEIRLYVKNFYLEYQIKKIKIKNLFGWIEIDEIWNEKLQTGNFGRCLWQITDVSYLHLRTKLGLLQHTTFLMATCENMVEHGLATLFAAKAGR